MDMGVRVWLANRAVDTRYKSLRFDTQIQSYVGVSVKPESRHSRTPSHNGHVVHRSKVGSTAILSTVVSFCIGIHLPEKRVKYEEHECMYHEYL